MKRFQVDPGKLCLWDILDNVELLGYGHHPFVYYRIPTVEFNCDGLVLIHNDDTVRQVINLLIKKGSVDIYVDHKIDIGEGCPKINEMVESSKCIMLEDAKEDSDSEKGVDVGGDELGADVDALEAVGEDLKALIEELHADCEEVMVIVNEGISPSADEGFLPVTGEGFGPNVVQRDEKVKGHESDYFDSSDPGEYGDSDESAEEICGTYSGKKTLGPRYDIKCAIPTWEVGKRVLGSYMQVTTLDMIVMW
ncbi:hypothetical protein V6N12_002769 [Hibiscus sabdariffa]|uniref:PB1-like domain-containing protein n=1 Tax=Hibiscus sabdariffa TaxID=183260 RepID=A0ABR2E9Y8_9ROSI